MGYFGIWNPDCFITLSQVKMLGFLNSFDVKRAVMEVSWVRCAMMMIQMVFYEVIGYVLGPPFPKKSKMTMV